MTISAYWLATLISGVLTFVGGATNLLPLSPPLSRLPFPFRAHGERAADSFSGGAEGTVGAQGVYFITSTERRTPLRRRRESKENRKGWWYDVL